MNKRPMDGTHTYYIGGSGTYTDKQLYEMAMAEFNDDFFFQIRNHKHYKNYLISNTTCLSRVPLDHRHLTTTLKTMSASTNLRSESTTHTRGDGSGNCARILKTGVTATGRPPCWEYLPDIYLGGCNGTRPIRTHTNQIMELTPV